MGPRSSSSALYELLCYTLRSWSSTVPGGKNLPSIKLKQPPAPKIPSGSRLVFGRNTVREVLKASPERCQLVYLSSKDSGSLRELEQEVRAARIKIEAVSEEVLSALCSSDSHQSVAALLKERDFQSLDDLIKELASRPRALILALDEIQDPHNLGAVLRAAECFGVDAVIWSKNRGVDLTAVVSKSSVGASELVNIIRISNLAQSLEKLKKENFWVVGADGGEGTTDLTSFDWPDRAVIVVGAEFGLQRLVRERSDFLVKIPMFGRIDSLNVSQAVAVLLFQYRQNCVIKDRT